MDKGIQYNGIQGFNTVGYIDILGIHEYYTGGYRIYIYWGYMDTIQGNTEFIFTCLMAYPIRFLDIYIYTIQTMSKYPTFS